MALKKAEVAKFKAILERLRDQLVKTLKGATEEVQKPDEATGYSQHQADQGTDDFDRTISIELSNQEYATLRQIERALEKIEEGTFGECDVTGKAIPKARLKAIPYATTTVEGQAMLEKGLVE